MSELTMQEKLIEEEPLSVPVFGYNLIREDVLTDLLGKDTPEHLYWAGKRLARKYPLKTIDEIKAFFEKAGWGTLSIKSESKHEMIFILESEVIVERLKANPASTFHLESGFLAQQTQFQKGVISEAFEHPNKKGGKVQFTVKWDLKDKVES